MSCLPPVRSKAVTLPSFPGGTYRGELGIYAENGLFLPILESNTVTTPGTKRMSPSENLAFAEVAVSKEETASVHPPRYYSGTLVMLKEKLNAKPNGLPFGFK